MAELTLEDILHHRYLERPCGALFEIIAEFSVAVGDCDNKTDQEKGRMAGGILASLRVQAEAQCTSDQCPQWQISEGEQIFTSCARNEPGKLIWSERWRFEVKCVA